MYFKSSNAFQNENDDQNLSYSGGRSLIRNGDFKNNELERDYINYSRSEATSGNVGSKNLNKSRETTVSKVKLLFK